jgi:hypothetical protein
MTDEPTPLTPKPRAVRCPVCGRSARPDHAPFCSARCRMVDLGRWFGEVYVVSTPASDRNDDEEGGDETR